MTIMERIELNPKVCNGKPVIKGTRIPISVILEQIAQGESWDDFGIWTRRRSSGRRTSVFA